MSLRNALCHFESITFLIRFIYAINFEHLLIIIKVGFDDYERNSHSSSLVALYDVRQQQGTVDNNRSSLLLFVFSLFKLVFNIGLQHKWVLLYILFFIFALLLSIFHRLLGKK